MENHPIPQDITGFQFKLIGSMTVKQFLYLAVGVIIGWFIFSSSLFFLVKWPLVLLFGGGGAALAFVPIGGRPLDVMIVNFIKAFFNDSTYIYDKAGENINQAVTPNRTAQVPTQQPQLQQAAPAIQKPIVETHLPNPVIQAQIQTANAPQTPVVQMSTPLVAQAVNKETLAQPVPTEPPQPIAKVMSSQKEPASKQPVDLPPAQPTAPVQAPPLPTVRQVPSSQTKSVGIPATPEDPNLVTGIIKDSRGNPLPNILVEIKDKEENPVRAFKTNGLGHFASATPLLDGSYTMEFEDIKGEHKFQKIAFECKGQVIMPFEIISTDKREELRRELFQN